MTSIKLSKGAPKGAKTEVLAVFMAQGAKAPAGLDQDTTALIERVLDLKEFSGKKGESKMLLPASGPVERLVLIGLGKEAEMTREGLRRAAGTAGKALADQNLAHGAVYWPLGIHAPKSMGGGLELGETLVEGLLLGAYTFTVYKPKKADPKDKTARKPENLTTIHLFDETGHLEAKGVSQGEKRAEAINRARDLGNHPSNVATPSLLAEEAEKIAKEHGLKCTVLGRKDLEKLGMHMFLGVAQGAHHPPKFIILEHHPKGAKGTLMLVGKGITFDTGGISIKPAAQMDEMKFDMCGAAAVLGGMQLIAQMDVPVNVVGIIPATENMPGGGAQKPGDIVTTYNGKTVEVLNTDAEGRLILGDALAYGVDKYKPDAIVDLATLTGACVVALGHYATGAVSNHPAWQDQVVAAGQKAGDVVWPFPAFPEYEDEIKGKFSDIKNIGSRYAGSITGGLFLKHFVDEVPWVHLDIAGTAWDVKSIGHIPNDGATGVGVALLADLALHFKAPKG